MVFSFINGGLFDLLSVDLAEYCTVVPDAATVRFTGYRSDGSTVTRDFTTTTTSCVAWAEEGVASCEKSLRLALSKAAKGRSMTQWP